MLTITTSASERIKAFVANQKKSAIRIHLKPSLDNAPSLGLTFDEPKKEDETFDVDGLTYLVDRELLARAQPIRIDHDGIAMRFSSRLSSEADGCGCGCGGH
jgi:iron-sulfur cluster assembly protein